MTNPNNQTNGASLEDCHTNFFALTDLCGIKWRKLVWGEWGEVGGGNGGELLEDPVLGSYVRCLAADLLCVWRRVSSPVRSLPGVLSSDGLFDGLGLPPAPLPPTPTTPSHPPLTLHTAKELWIFWYGEEPDLTKLVSPELLESGGEQGSWESGLSYECRSLLFKALHNLIERCLLSRDFIRIGRWYLQPYDSNDKIQDKSGHLSFAFDFFVHGESNVCASVDVQMHPPVRTLMTSHIQQAATPIHSAPPINVLLAPYGLAGQLTGVSFRGTEPSAKKTLDEWRQFYPMDKVLEGSEVPPLVEVIVGSTRMKHPSYLTVLTDLDKSTEALFNNNNGVGSGGSAVGLPGNGPPARGHHRGGLLAERVWQECCLMSNSATSLGHWSFHDPARKQACSCSSKMTCTVTSVGADSVPIASVGSPTSVGAPGTPTPASVPPPDPTMPTLSPQPPPPHQSPLDDKVVSTPTDFNAPKSVSSVSNQLSPYGEGVKSAEVSGGGKTTPLGGGPASVGQASVGACAALSAGTPPPSSVAAPAPPSVPPPSAPQPVSAPVSGPLLPKRPRLVTSEYEDALAMETQPSKLLYDYSTLEAWLNHPVKKYKPTPVTNVPSPSPNTLQVFKSEPGEDSPFQRGLGQGDPYEFEEDVRVPSLRGPSIKEEDKGTPNGSTKMGTGNLFTSEGLQVSVNDLDQIFDAPDDNSGDEAVLQVTPPSSNKAPDETCVTTLVTGPRAPPTGILRPEELSKMFPTPPSLEHNPIASPLTALMGDTGTEPPGTSPSHAEPIHDWSYVFKPPTTCKFVGSSKYAPLTNLPSATLPAVTLPACSVYKPSWDRPPQPQETKPRRREQNSPGRATPQAWGTPQAPLTPQTQAVVPARSLGPGGAPPPYSPVPAPPYPTAPPKPAEPSLPLLPEANSLVVTILLSDTAFNIFRDHNFDSCTLCVCNAGPKVVGNIRGSDAGLYLPVQGSAPVPSFPSLSPSPHLLPDEETIRCNCGFSAVVNRALAHRSGLFLEDELEITGMLDENGPERESLALTGSVMELLREQCLSIVSSSNSLVRAAAQYRPLSPLPSINLLALRDSNYLAALAIEQGRLAASTHLSMCKMEEMGCMQAQAMARGSTSAVHRWGFLRARGPPSNQDIIRVMKQLQPLLQDAIQKKCSTRLWEAPTVSGPLTWRQFHRLAGRGTDDRCGPQPIPSLLVGRDKDWVSLAPYGLHLWEKLLLEPFSYARDVAYIVVAPDNEFLLTQIRLFFKELSSMYEVCRLGRHCPITKVLRDGILRVGTSAAQKLANEPIDEWFRKLGDSPVAAQLRLYAQVCRHHLAPHLSQVPMDKTLLEPPEREKPQQPTPSPRPPEGGSQDSSNSAVNPHSSSPQDETSNGYTSSENTAPTPGSGSSSPHDDDDSNGPHIVIYLVEPFTIASESPEVQKLACVGLLRAFGQVMANVPDAVRNNISVQIISMESIAELGRSTETDRRTDHMRTLALSVFSQARRTMAYTTTVKALTGFGTAAQVELFLKNKDEKNKKPYKVYLPAYILASRGNKVPNPSNAVAAGTNTTAEGGLEQVAPPEKCAVLYVSYCLSEDQRWLLASATDDSGLLLETIAINVHIPNRNRRRRASARRAGLQKLMDFILGVMSQSVTPWRLVVGRMGRIGHGELKGWSWLLSRKSLLKASKMLKEICTQCAVLYPNDVPCILSACLVSLEPDSALRLMPDQHTPDERFSSKCHLSTPQDVTATHILVFPTSATTQSSQTAFLQEQHINGELGEDFLSVLNDDMPEGMSDFNDLFSWTGEGDGGGARSPGSPGRGGRAGDLGSAPSSPTAGVHHTGPSSPFAPHAAVGRNGEPLEEVGTLLQQPLALGYLVSTAPTGRMPRWFWQACPHLENVCPAFLKVALHMHSTAIQTNSDDLLQQQPNVSAHPLDSQYTTDVLRYVLEGYNSLSWLVLDPNTHDRLSCLPVHGQLLMQLYHMTSALT